MEDGEVIEEKPPLLREAPHERTEDLLTSAPPWQGEPLSDPQATKAIQVLEACNSRDVKVLIAHAISPHGLVEDDIRRLACRSFYVI